MASTGIYSAQNCEITCDPAIVTNGTYAMYVDSTRDAQRPDRFMYMFIPKGIMDKKVPCIFLYPQYGEEDVIEYHGLISYLVSRGVVVVYPQYRPLSFRRKQIQEYNISVEMFRRTASAVVGRIDTTRIGFIGHGFGAGLLPALVGSVAQTMQWGNNGIFIYVLSPWYFHGISQRELETYPKNVSLVVQVFDNDNINDPLIACNLFSMIGIPDRNKEFYILQNDRRSGCRLVSDFSVPLSSEAMGGEDNIFDTLGVYRIADQLLKSVFGADTNAHLAVFGSGLQRSINMGVWRDGTPVKAMIATDKPAELLERKPYINLWISPRNPYVETSRFKNWRRMYVDHRMKKIQQLAKHVSTTKKAEEGELENVDVLENPIDSGYGASGTYTMRIDSVANPLNGAAPVLFFKPAEADRPFPVAILLHGYSGPDYRYFEPLIRHMVSKGIAMLYPPYPSLPLVNSEQRVMEKIAIIKKGLELGIEKFKPWMDSTRVVVIGQSFGAGMAPTIGYTLFQEKKWGAEGACMFIMAPWYCFGMSQEQLQGFPRHVKLIMQVYDDDQTNDHQMAVDVFNAIGIPKEEKDYIILYSDSFEGYTMNANHFVPYGTLNIYGEENLLDYYGIFRLFDALVDYSFNKNPAAKTIALGNGGREQIYMGEWADNSPCKPCSSTDTPTAYKTQYQYLWSWENPLNPRLKPGEIKRLRNEAAGGQVQQKSKSQ